MCSYVMIALLCISNLLMNGLLFQFSIALSVSKIGCLQNPNIQTDWLKSLVLTDASMILFTIYHPINFKAAHTLSTCGHNKTMPTLAPVLCRDDTWNILPVIQYTYM